MAKYVGVNIKQKLFWNKPLGRFNLKDNFIIHCNEFATLQWWPL